MILSCILHENKNAKLVFGRLNISNKEFLEEATLNIFTVSTVTTVNRLSQANQKSAETKRLIFRNSVYSEYGKRLRWDLETNLSEFTSDGYFSRNELLNDNVRLIENKDTRSTDILQE